MKKKFHFLLLFLFLFITTNLISQNLWEPAGIDGGAVSTILKVNNNIFLAGNIGGGLFRSTDGGSSWNSISNKINNLQVFTLSMNSSGDVFAGTVQSIFKSTDQGLSWTKVNSSFPPSAYAEDIVFDATGNIYVAGANNGVFKSTDDGNNWVQINSGLPGSRYITKLCFTSNNILLASDIIRGVYKSTDFGNNWVKSSTGLDTTYYVTSFSSSSSGEIFISTAGDGPYKSTDNGNTWVSIKGDLSNNYNLDIDFDSNGHLYLTSNQQIYKSTNGGVNWSTLTLDYSGAGFSSSYIDNNNNIWAATTYSGIIKSTDGGTNWNVITSGLTATQVRALVADASGNLYAALPGKGLYSSTDNGNSWNKLTIVDNTQDTYIRTVEVLPSGGLIVYNVYNKIYITTNFTNWNSFSNGLDNQNIWELAVTNDYYFAAGSDGKVFRSPRTSANWVEITNPAVSGYCYDLFVSSAGELFYLFDQQIYKSTNNGNDWINVGSGVNGYKFSIAQNSFGDLFVGTDQGVYRSTNGGTSWTEDLSGLNDGGLSLAVFGGSTVFAGGYSSVSKSTDSGQNWSAYTTGIENFHINQLAFGHSDVLFALAENVGVYRTVSSVSSVFDSDNFFADNFILNQNYPNPFNPSTKITWQSPISGHHSLKVYDVLGNEVATLLDDYRAAGNYELDFDAQNLSSGVYFYKLSVDNFNQTRKMILIR